MEKNEHITYKQTNTHTVQEHTHTFDANVYRQISC